MLISKRDKILFYLLLPPATTLLCFLVLTILVISSISLDSIQIFGIKLFISNIWNPEHEEYGLIAPIIGSISTSIIAILTAFSLAMPLSIFIAEYLYGFTKKVFSSIIEVMGGLPTILYAMWASTYLVPVLKNYVMEILYSQSSFIPLFSCKPITGFSVFAAGVSIGISIVPYVVAMISEAYQSIPFAYKEACYGIGATRYETIKMLVSIAKPAILASLILGFARSLGETTIAVATVGNSMYLSSCIFAPSYTVSALIASQFANAYLYRYAGSVLYVGALVILAISILLSFLGLTIIIKWRTRLVV